MKKQQLLLLKTGRGPSLNQTNESSKVQWSGLHTLDKIFLECNSSFKEAKVHFTDEPFLIGCFLMESSTLPDKASQDTPKGLCQSLHMGFCFLKISLLTSLIFLLNVQVKMQSIYKSTMYLVESFCLECL